MVRVRPQTLIDPGDPAVGLDALYAVPANTVYRLHTFLGDLQTDATVANRWLRFVIRDDAGRIVYYGEARAAQIASLTVRHSGATLCPAFGAPTDVPVGRVQVRQFFLPDIALLPGWEFGIEDEVGLAAGDQWLNVAFLAEVVDVTP